MTRIRKILLATSLLAAITLPASAEVNVVASMKPVHSLVAAVMEGIGTPQILVEGAGSPHDYALKPSQARMLQEADVVFWIGHELEAFLEKNLETIAANARSVELINADGLVRLGFREGGAFEKHSHGEHEKNAEHNHDHSREREHEQDQEEHAGDELDPHIWLDPVNARAMVHEIGQALAAADPAHATRYEANARAVTTRLEALVAEIDAELAPVKGRAFIVFHDAYHYFENRFGMTATGSITVSPEVMPGAERIRDIRHRIEELGATCVFSEPQFEPKLISTVTEGTNAKSGVIDPLGADLENGPELYFQVIRNMATSMKDCLSQGK